jgi:hypothetical protein
MNAPAHLVEAELLQMASTGDRSAQAAMRDRCALLAYEGVTPFELVCMAEGFARLAAAQGGQDDDAWLAAILRYRALHVAQLGDYRRAAVLVAQSEAICDKYQALDLTPGVEFLAGVLTAFADAGDELAADRLNKLATALSPVSAQCLSAELRDSSPHPLADAPVTHG